METACALFLMYSIDVEAAFKRETSTYTFVATVNK